MTTRILAVALAGALYVLGCHWLMTRPDTSAWDVVGVLAPMLAAIGIGAWRAGQRWLAAGMALLVGALCTQAVLGLRVPTQALYLAQHVGIHLFLACVFGATLRAGETPLITTLARRVHREFTPTMAAYTRRCTQAWTVYFAAMALVSLALYRFGSFDAWAVFANLLTPLTLVAMFGGEHLLRYRLHPEFERASVADAIRSYRLHAKAPAVAAGRDRAA